MAQVLLRTASVVVVVVVFAGCTPAEEQPGAMTAETTSTEADVEAVHRVRETHDAAVNAGDLEAYLAVFAEDAVLMPPNEPPVLGKEATRAWGQGLFSQFSFEETMSSEEVVVAGDWGFDRGTYTIRPTPKVGGEAAEGTPIEQPEIGRELDYAQTGKYLWILKRQGDGSWKTARAMWSSNHPPPGM
ncbi:MAG: YybH family protein [Candidatus Methylomirabilales bacterium]